MKGHFLYLKEEQSYEMRKGTCCKLKGGSIKIKGLLISGEMGHLSEDEGALITRERGTC